MQSTARFAAAARRCCSHARHPAAGTQRRRRPATGGCWAAWRRRHTDGPTRRRTATAGGAAGRGRALGQQAVLHGEARAERALVVADADRQQQVVGVHLRHILARHNHGRLGARLLHAAPPPPPVGSATCQCTPALRSREPRALGTHVGAASPPLGDEARSSSGAVPGGRPCASVRRWAGQAARTGELQRCAGAGTAGRGRRGGARLGVAQRQHAAGLRRLLEPALLPEPHRLVGHLRGARALLSPALPIPRARAPRVTGRQAPKLAHAFCMRCACAGALYTDGAFHARPRGRPCAPVARAPGTPQSAPRSRRPRRARARRRR